MNEAVQHEFVPPFVPPAAKAQHTFALLSRLILNNLSIIPEAAYERDVVVLKGPPRLVFVTGEEAVAAVLRTQHANFPKGKLQNSVLDPLFGNAMISSEGVDWRWQRGAAAPLFRHSELQDYGPIMTSAAEATINKWLSEARDTRFINRDMMYAAFAVISRTMLAGGAPDVIDQIEKGHTEYFRVVNWWIAYRMLGLPGWLPRPGASIMRSHTRNIKQSVRELIEQRRKSPGNDDDLLGRLLEARDPKTGRAMGDKRLVNNLIAFLVAGYDTTALSLSWALYLLSKNPYWAAAIRKEVDEICGTAPVSADHVEKLTVTNQVMSETLRLFPTAPVIVRDVLEETDICGTKLRAGDVVIVPIYAIHRHRSHWSDPDRFDPSRFGPDQPKPSRHVYLPFGAGQRICIGAAFATIETAIMLASFVRAADFETVGDEPEPVGQMFLTPRNGIEMKVTLR